jgi:ribosomal protein S8
MIIDPIGDLLTRIRNALRKLKFLIQKLNLTLLKFLRKINI